MTKGETITRAQLWLDDTSELSDQEFSDLYDTNYRKINRSRPWQGTKKEGSTTTSTSVPYVNLETDFVYLTANGNYTDASYEASRPVIFRGSNYSRYEVVNWDDRRQYRNNDGFAYIDKPNNRLYFTKQPTVAELCEYDYHSSMPMLTNEQTPWFGADYADQLFHMMVADDIVIQASPKAKSYRNENLKLAKEGFDALCYANAQLVQI